MWYGEKKVKYAGNNTRNYKQLQYGGWRGGGEEVGRGMGSVGSYKVKTKCYQVLHILDRCQISFTSWLLSFFFVYIAWLDLPHTYNDVGLCVFAWIKTKIWQISNKQMNGCTQSCNDLFVCQFCNDLFVLIFLVTQIV